jgi:hypothetical protein
MAYQLEDLDAAKKDLADAQDGWERYDGNNPDKYRTPVSEARAKVATIEASLKAAGLIPLSEHEQLERTLDTLYPKAASRQVVEHEGNRYQKYFTPVSKSLSGKTVKAWNQGWRKLTS